MIRNKIAESGLVTLDLIDFYDTSPRKSIDLTNWLEDGLIIKENSFKDRLRSIDHGSFKGVCVNIFCSTDVIIPTWAYMLIQAEIQSFAKEVFFGNRDALELYLFQKKIHSVNFSKYKKKRVFVKSCKNKHLPVGAFSIISTMLIPHVKSLFYGEPCSNVPLIKN